MMNRYGLRLAILIIPFVILVAGLSLLPAVPVVYAQEPTPECVTISTTVTLDHFVNEYVFYDVGGDYEARGIWEVPGYPIENAIGISDTVYAGFYAYTDQWRGWSFSLENVISGAITITTHSYQDNMWDTGMNVHPSLDADMGGAGWINLSNGWDHSYSGQVGSIAFFNKGGVLGGGESYLDAANIEIVGCYYPTEAFQQCPTVTDFHFTGTPTDTWILGDATILSSTVTINTDGFAYQNLVSGTLENNLTYSAVVSVTNITAATAYLLVELHTYSQTLVITQSGLYTASFDIARYGPIGDTIYDLTNIGEGLIELDWTCIYAGEAPTGLCFGPENGTFDNDDNWDWEDYAHHNNATLSANFPLNLVYPWSYITSTSVTALPSLAENKYMLLEFDAVTINNECSGGLLTIKGRQIGDVMSYTNTYTKVVSNQRQTYQIDLSSLAGTNVQFLFGNNGGDGQYTDAIDLDNVCVFVSDDPPATTTTDPGGVVMMCNASGWFGCDDIDGILAYLGVDMAAQREIYAAGVSLWDYEGWVPWIVAAWWVMVATILCFFLVLITSIINLITYFLNNVLNYINWVLVNWPLFVAWLGGWLTTIRSSIYYAIEWARLTAINWLVWLGNAIIEFSEVPWYVIGALGVITSFIFGGFWWLANLFIPLLIYLVAGGDNMLRSIINYLIANGWNGGLLTILSSLASTILDTLVVLWNYLAPFFMAIFSAVIGPVGILLILFPVIWNFIWSAFMYMWVNIIQPLNIPLAFYTGLSDGVKSGAFSSLMACNGSTGNFWCGLFTGLDLLNGVAGASVLYPIIIAAIIIGTISILYKNIVGLWHFFADIITKI